MHRWRSWGSSRVLTSCMGSSCSTGGESEETGVGEVAKLPGEATRGATLWDLVPALCSSL